jgi:Ca-dependent carbohydrate-binding module xylan-binding
MAQAPARTADFITTLGVNTHIPYTDGGYANIPNVIADIQYLGLSQIRDTITDGADGSAPLSSYIALAQKGIQFTICLFVGGDQATADLTAQLSLVSQLEKAVPGSVLAVEGANEINNFPITYNGVGGLQGAVNLQTAIYSAVHSNAALAGVAVDYFTGYAAGAIAAGPNPATTAGLADFDTQHPYPNDGEAPLQWVSRTAALNNETPATGPAVYTETGYSSNGGTDGDVNADVQAKYTLDLLMDDAQSGVAHTDLYQLMDAYAAGSPQGDDGYGLFDPSNQPKEVATGIHDLTTILADPGATAKTFTPTPITYSVTGLPTTGHSLELQKSSGASDIVVWNEPQIWNEATGKETTAATANVTVQLGATYKTVEVFDPLQSSAPLQTLSNVSSVALGLTDHPLIVEVEPQTGTTTPPVVPPVTPPVVPPVVVTPDTLTLRVSEDAWQGNAEFTVKVDGQQVGGVMTATALHSSGDANTFQLTGDWGAKAHDVQLQFLNDAYGGSAATDRNLYVNSIAYDGVTDAGTSATMMSAGTHDFTVGGATAAAATPADLLTLHLSGDDWNGDPQFSLLIDGKPASASQGVTAVHSAGQWQNVSFSGNFGAGAHTIGIQFTNDSYGGTATTDRNLYLNGIDLNGQHYGSGATEMTGNGTTTFHVVTTA